MLHYYVKFQLKCVLKNKNRKMVWVYVCVWERERERDRERLKGFCFCIKFAFILNLLTTWNPCRITIQWSWFEIVSYCLQIDFWNLKLFFFNCKKDIKTKLLYIELKPLKVIILGQVQRENINLIKKITRSRFLFSNLL